MKTVLQLSENFLEKLILNRKTFSDKVKEKGEIIFINSFNDSNLKEIKFENFKNSPKKENDFEDKEKYNKCYLKFKTNYYDEFNEEIIYTFEILLKKGNIHFRYLGGSPNKEKTYNFDEIILPYYDVELYFMDEFFDMFLKNDDNKELNEILNIFLRKIKPFILYLLEVDG